MNKKEAQEKWEKELKAFLDKHNKIMEGMTEKESTDYIRKNKLNQKIQEMAKKYKEESTQ